ncbi:MAG: hypothetical protein OEZ36_12155, partial [Spirochaetota bacterium]|nr:hypothetical protein [Spirochaetota bacterium]
MDVYFVLPPFSPENCPSLGLSLLKASLSEKNITSKIHYSNLIFMNGIHELYDKLSFTTGYYLLYEQIFSPYAFPELKQKHSEYERDIRDLEFATSVEDLTLAGSEVIDLRDRAGDFLQELAEELSSQGPKIVGIQSNFHQICFSLALARRLKSLNPDIVIAMGGFNCTESMGQEILKLSESIDYIFSGEAEKDFTEFCVNGLKDNKFPSSSFIRCEKMENLNDLPYPDFDDYFEQVAQVYMPK